MVADGRVVEYMSVSVLVSKLGMLRYSSILNWRCFSEDRSYISASHRRLIPRDHGSLYAVTRWEEWGCHHWRFRVKVHIVQLTKLPLLHSRGINRFMDSWPQLPPPVSQVCHKSHTQHTVANQPPHGTGVSCVLANVSQVSPIHYLPTSHRLSKQYCMFN